MTAVIDPSRSAGLTHAGGAGCQSPTLTAPTPSSSAFPRAANDHFHKLAADLGALLGPCNGIDDVDENDIIALMEQYKSNEREWAMYAFADASRGYTRNLVSRGNGKSNLLVLVWTPGKGSPIHDHANAHCVLKVLKGALKETVYNWPEEGQEQTVSVKQETIHSENAVTYMNDTLGLHRVSNPSATEFAVSLHLYTPPNAEHHGCQIFDPKSGRASHITMSSWFSEFGKKL